MAGFNKLSCEGIVGDGCGGGRVFTIKNEVLTAFDPQSSESIVLLKGIKDAVAISKRSCIIYIKCKETKIEFDLSTFKN